MTKTPEVKKRKKWIYVVSSVSSGLKHGSRAWSFWDSLEKATKSGVFGWGRKRKDGTFVPNGEFFYENKWYDWVVIEKVPVNHPLPSSECRSTVWYKLVPHKNYDKNMIVKMVKVERPEEFKRVIGFY